MRIIIDFLISLFYRYYPQYEWYQHIYPEIAKLGLEENTTIVDMPCGDGVISYWLHKNIQFSEFPFELLDISFFLTMFIKIWTGKKKNISVKNNDIRRMTAKEKANDVWLLVNSLFLFKENLILIRRYYPRFKYIIGIFPYIHKTNYQYYKNKFYSHNNPGAENREDTIRLFKEAGYAVQKTVELTNLCYYKYNLFGIDLLLERYFFNIIKNRFKDKESYYWMGVFQRV
jgi:hypothetical protein